MKQIIIGSFLFIAAGCAGVQQARPVAAGFHSEEQKVFFDFGASSVRPGDQEVLQRLASEIKRKGKALAILEGHTDLIGSDYYNEILAEDRARAVRVSLRDLGIDPSRTTIVSKGKREPAVKGISKEANQANRRVEIILAFVGGRFR